MYNVTLKRYDYYASKAAYFRRTIISFRIDCRHLEAHLMAVAMWRTGVVRIQVVAKCEVLPVRTGEEMPPRMYYVGAI